MKVCKPMFLALALCFTFAMGGLTAHAQGPRPAYLHALSDLRLMRAYLSQVSPNERIDDESQHAIAEIDAAIREIKMAAIDDGKDVRDHAPIDARILPVDRFHRAREAGHAAAADLDHVEEDAVARGLKHRALDHIHRANEIVDHIMHRFDR